jgi:hypothetical protein
MSTKNLARTVIEGGRARYSKWLRYHSHGRERCSERMVSSRLLKENELDDAVYPARGYVYRRFYDKLGPAERWLASQVGRPWNKVRSELFARFDARTTAGRHILVCHLLPSVITSVHEASFFSRRTFTVDAHGILRRRVRPERWRSPLYLPLPEPSDVLEAWLGGRRVGERAPHLYWFVPTPAGSFRQHQRLTDTEAVRWRALPDWFRQQCNAVQPLDARNTG